MTTLDKLPATTAYADIVIPDYCGPVGRFYTETHEGITYTGFDLNRGNTCPRAGRIDMLVSDREEIERERGRIGRLRNSRRAANLTAWVAAAEHRFAVLYGILSARGDLDEANCQHAPEHRRVISSSDREAALPACTC